MLFPRAQCESSSVEMRIRRSEATAIVSRQASYSQHPAEALARAQPDTGAEPSTRTPTGVELFISRPRRQGERMVSAQHRGSFTNLKTLGHSPHQNWFRPRKKEFPAISQSRRFITSATNFTHNPQR